MTTTCSSLENDGMDVPVPVEVAGSSSFTFQITPTKYEAFFRAYAEEADPRLGRYAIVDFLNQQAGHAWWMFSCNAPSTGLHSLGFVLRNCPYWISRSVTFRNGNSCIFI